jgi:glycosyltransferase involved in cell wall biosynthesis
MKILINMISLFQGGPKTVALGLLEGVSNFLEEETNKSYNFVLIIPDIKEIKNRIYELNLHNKATIIKTKYPYKNPRFIYKLFYDHFYTSYIAKKFNIDAIFMTANFSCLFTSRPQIVLLHNIHYLQDDHPFKNIKSKIKFYLEKKLFFLTLNKKNTNYIVQLNYIKDKFSQFTKKQIFIREMIPPEKDFTCAKEDFKILKEKFKNYDKFIKLFLPAKYHPNKNFFILKILGEYVLKRQLPMKLFVTLQDNEYNDFIGKSKQLKSIIINVGTIEYKKIRCYYQIMDALFFPSTSESYGFPLVEAALTGKPVILPYTPFGEELIGDRGYFFNINNIHSLFNIIEGFIEDYRVSNLKIPKKDKFNCSWKEYVYFILKILQKEKEKR